MINKVIYQGRLTKDPELKQTTNGTPALLFTIAWSEKYKDTERKCFLLCRAWSKTAEFIAKYFRKGSEIIIEGKMNTEDWGDNTIVLTCGIEKAHFCGPKQEDAPAAPAPPAQQTARKPKAKPAPQDPYTQAGFVNVPPGYDDELPYR